ncbi:MAG: TadE/TadG family type IV pilus assembly protein [Micropruina sp.]|uniref:TadE/TadG family type IV pilus assembly protein n=1 Tax=Micropruina sp. TaxID=2737536 RepID=UPI0039E43FCF
MSERGAAESTQWALLVPALLLTVLGTIQAGVWLHGRDVAAQAATAAAEHIAWDRGSDSDATAMGWRIADAGGLVGADVRIERRAGTVRVVVTGQAPLIVDLGLGAVTEHAVMPLERTGR